MEVMEDSWMLPLLLCLSLESQNVHVFFPFLSFQTLPQ